MSHLNVEIKARCSNPASIRNYLLAANAVFKGEDLQSDTYFNVREGRLKLREGNIENHLVYYERPDKTGPKNSRFHLLAIPDARAFKEVMAKAVGIKTVVKKKREIYFIKNVKFHLDTIEGLGNFVEIEAGNLTADLPVEALTEQCNFYVSELKIQESDLLRVSYSDMIESIVNDNN